jgi:hypothetical protein
VGRTIGWLTALTFIARHTGILSAPAVLPSPTPRPRTATMAKPWVEEVAGVVNAAGHRRGSRVTQRANHQRTPVSWCTLPWMPASFRIFQ